MWKRYRRAAALLQAAIILGLPFVRINGQSALRFDVPEQKLHAFGTVIWMNEFYLVLLAVLFLLFLVVAVTAIMGRVWCGWACPQTVLLDLGDDLVRVLPKSMRRTGKKLVLVPVAALVSLSLIWYFEPPRVVMANLFSSKVIFGFFVVQWAVVWLELAFLGRRFCTTICPYSSLQTGFFDSETLVVSFDEARRPDCMGCDRCVQECPVGIDIKEGLKRECIACAGCIDACTAMTGPRGLTSFIGYRGRVFRRKALALFGAAAVMGLVFVIAFLVRPELAFVMKREAYTSPLGLNRYTYTITNNKSRELTLAIEAEGPFVMLGDKTITIPPNGRAEGTVLLKPTGTGQDAPGRAVFWLRGAGVELRREAGFL